jgi:hypothetical protein
LDLTLKKKNQSIGSAQNKINQLAIWQLQNDDAPVVSFLKASFMPPLFFFDRGYGQLTPA